ncbi:hypothetical protein ACFY36_13105 [Actinoplanes sp. NPDC000266]
MDPVAAVTDDVVMVLRRWVIIGAGIVSVAAVGVTAWLFGPDGVEYASWLAGIAGLMITAGTLALARQHQGRPEIQSLPSSIHITGSNDGILSTGDHASNTQQK